MSSSITAAALEPCPASFGSMFPFTEERSRNKGRLEASLAALCELELLKQRQESRVLSALCLGDDVRRAPGRTAWTELRATARCGTDARDGDDAPGRGGLRLHTSSLQCTPWGIMASLEQHVAQLNVNAEVKLADFPTVLDDSQASAEISLPKEAGLPVEAATLHQRLPRSLSAPNGMTEIEPRDTWLSDLARSTLFADALAELKSLEQGQEGIQQVQKAETYIFGLIQRKALSPRPSKPRTSLAPDARATGVVRQSSLCRKEDQHSPKQVPVQVIPEVPSPVLFQSQVPDRIPSLAAHNMDQERFQGSTYIDEPPPPYHHLPQNIQHQPGPYHKTKKVPMVANRSISLEYPSCRVIPSHVDSSNSEPDSPHNFQGGYSPAVPKHQPPPEEHLVNAEYIPAQPCRASTRAYAHHHHHHHSSGKSSGASKPNRSAYSPERTHHHQEQQPTQSQPSRSRSNAKKCEKNGAARKQGKKASRSQSENSLQRAPERKCGTVERDGAGSGSGSRGSRGSQSKSKKQHHHGNGNYRRWQSSLELSQDEAEQPHGPPHMQVHPTPNQRDQCSKRTRKSRPTHPSYAYPTPSHHHHQHLHAHHHHHQHMEYQMDSRPVEDYHHGAQGESESSTSEADSPDSSSLSSDSDESGGLVWPQQLPPQLTHPPPAAAAAAAAAPGGPLQQKAFVKIKASHALKKKILRFRTGSLKVMTTV
ncbi:uncharacterized protein [Eucyclogobius newberryi]|uniref:uncharacterized protein n=1 Tax=Eucyclogobius newberryi TaxID=166745 RepID=UPI003B5B045A